MSHEYKCCAIFCSCFHAVISSFFASFICDSLCNRFFVIVDYCSIIANFTKHWFCDRNRFKFIFVFINCFCHFIVFSTMHQMCRLNNKIFYAIINCTVKCLLHIVNHFIISCLYMVDDDLSCKCTSYRPVRICFLKFIFNSFDILSTAIVERCTKAYNKKFVLTDFILVTRIIFGCITSVTSEVIRISFFAFNQFLLSVCQFIPCFFGSFAVFICCISSFLNIDLVDQCCYFICCFLIIRSFFSVCCFCCLCIFFCCCLSSVIRSILVAQCNYFICCCLIIIGSFFCIICGFCIICCFFCCCLSSVIRSVDACRSHHCDCCYSHCNCQCFYSFVFHVFFLLYLFSHKN